MLCPKCERLSRCPCEDCKKEFAIEDFYIKSIHNTAPYQTCPYCNYIISEHHYKIWEYRRYKFWKIINRDI